jgi:hypothetical protein
LEIPFILFVTTYALAFYSEKKVSWMVTLAVVGRCVFLSIPSLKYVWFQGTAIDQQVQYGLANQVYAEGYIARQGPFNVSVYGSTPLFHLVFAIFSMVLGIPVADSIKYIPVFLSPIYPLLTYVIVKNVKFLQGARVLKYALLISSIPIERSSYLVTGSQFGVLLSFLVLTSLVLLLRKRDRPQWFVFLFFSFALAMAHSASSIMLTALVLTVALIQKAPFTRLGPHLRATVVLAVVSICGTWLMFPAEFTLGSIMRVIFGVQRGVAPVGGSVPSRFFELARVNIMSAVNSIIVYTGGDALILLLTIIGLIILLNKQRHVDSSSKFILASGGGMLVLILVGFMSSIGGFRAIYFASILFPIFSSVFFLYVAKKRIWVHAVVFSLIVLLGTLQLYGCQPLIPSASTLSHDLPTSEPLAYVTSVNSIYQRQMIRFAGYHVAGRIASDSITENQIIGLTEFNFSTAHLTHYYPLDSDQPREEYDYFFIHLPGASGGFEERAEVRTADLTTESIYDSGVVYTDGGSYILTPYATNPHD